jgi:glycosyltransferase involved in cell wall biosynthesis
MILSILIPTLTQEFIFLKRLMAVLKPQVERYATEVEIILDDRGKSVTTGEKRNYLIKQSSGEYVVFIDTDDLVPIYYIDEILKAAHNDSDCITFRGFMTTDGKRREPFVLRMGESYEKRDGTYYRWPNHIVPIKRQIASTILFPNKTYGEDYAWSKKINDLGLIKTETFIDKEMYHYDYRTKKR